METATSNTVPTIERELRQRCDDLTYLHLFLSLDDESLQRFSLQNDRLMVQNLVKNVIEFSSFLDSLPGTKLRFFFSVLVMVFLRCSDILVKSVVEERAEAFAEALKAMLKTTYYARSAITICWKIYGNICEDYLPGRAWGDEFLEKYDVTRNIQFIADNDDDFWDDRTVDAARIILPR